MRQQAATTGAAWVDSWLGMDGVPFEGGYRVQADGSMVREEHWITAAVWNPALGDWELTGVALVA